MPHESTVEHEKTLFDVPAGLSLNETIKRLQIKQQEQDNEIKNKVIDSKSNENVKKETTKCDSKSSAIASNTLATCNPFDSPTKTAQPLAPTDEQSRKSSTVPNLFPKPPKAITHHHDTDEEDSSTESN